jgi:hypothetical protein
LPAAENDQEAVHKPKEFREIAHTGGTISTRVEENRPHYFVRIPRVRLV